MFPYSLTKHLYTHHRENKPEQVKKKPSDTKSDTKEVHDMTCKYCGKEYSSKTIVSHYRRSHPDEYFASGDTERKQYQCNQCDEKYLMLQGLYRY